MEDPDILANAKAIDIINKAKVHTESGSDEFEERVASFAAGSAIFAASYGVPKQG